MLLLDLSTDVLIVPSDVVFQIFGVAGSCRAEVIARAEHESVGVEISQLQIIKFRPFVLLSENGLDLGFNQGERSIQLSLLEILLIEQVLALEHVLHLLLWLLQDESQFRPDHKN